MTSDYLNSLTSEDIGNELTNEVVIAVKKIYGNNGFVIFACEGNFTVKGNYAGDIVEGGNYLISGKIGVYGRQLQITASSIQEIKNQKTDNSYIASFLVESFPGVGNKTALKLAESYGEDVLFKLLHDYRNVSKEIPGLSLVRAKEINSIIDENEESLKFQLKMRLLGLTKLQSEHAINAFGLTVYEEILSNPYILMRCPNIGFETCERIAANLNVDAMNELRFEGAIVSVLERLHISTGDTYFCPGTVKSETLNLLGNVDGKYPEDFVDSLYEDAVNKGIKDKLFVVYHFSDNKCSACGIEEEDARISLMIYFRCEAGIKREIESFINATKVVPDFKKAEKKILEIASDFNIIPDENQMKALVMCMYEPFAIITGGPGTGKTTITGILAQHFKNEGIKCEFCAPTGRAAKRLSDASGVKANTIHRLLEMSADSEEENSEVRFGRNINNPIDARVIVVDEASMIDTLLFKALLSAIKPNASIILIGDPNQLPSVGAGNVLEDLLSCAKIPKVSLEYVFRQEDESSIASNSLRILRGNNVISNDDDFICVNTSSDEEALDIVKNLSNDYKDSDCVILCPTKQNILGTISLNRELQELLVENKKSPIKVKSDLVLYRNDKVMQIKNNYKIEYFDPYESSIVNGIFNGEIGVVSDSDFLTGSCNIIFDGERNVSYDKKMLADIDLAYSMTVHKAQGCEFDTVIIVLGKMNYKLSNRKLLYTAVTRGKKRVIIVNSNGRLEKMIKAVDVEKRSTSLKDFLKIVEGKTYA